MYFEPRLGYCPNLYLTGGNAARMTYMDKYRALSCDRFGGTESCTKAGKLVRKCTHGAGKFEVDKPPPGTWDCLCSGTLSHRVAISCRFGSDS